ncbi:MAG: hypothetical protein Q7U10_02840 [Thermodesulfovibrionia bacterium]|nr:hypothetical protein [Thermodesulfovibrionia bacterium]
MSTIDSRPHNYNISEVYEILTWLQTNFGGEEFPLANNVAHMGNGTEQDGLGVAILNLTPGNILHAQGSSYLGVVLEEVDILKWNDAAIGIKWRIINMPTTSNQLKEIINTHLS